MAEKPRQTEEQSAGGNEVFDVTKNTLEKTKERYEEKVKGKNPPTKPENPQKPRPIDKDIAKETREEFEKRENVLTETVSPDEETVVGKKNVAEPTKVEKKPKEEAKSLTPEEQAKQSLENEYPKERESAIIEKGIEQKLKDPGFITACERNIQRKLLEKSGLSEKERRSLIDDGNFPVKGFLQKLDIRDVAGLVAGGMSIKEIKNIKVSFFTEKVKMPDGEERTSEEFDKEIEKKIREKVEATAKEEVTREWERRKKEWVDSESIRIQAQQAESKEKPEKQPEKKIEKQEKLSVDDRVKQVNKLINTWKDAEKISKALKSGRKIKTKNGETDEVFDPKIEAQKEELIEAGKALSDEIINIANHLTGRKLKAEAYKETGYTPDPENPNKEKQAEFRKWLTLEVEKIYKEQKKIIEKEAKEIKEKKDKKVRFKKELPLKAKEAIVITPNDEALPVPEEKEPGDDKAELKERLAKIEELEAQKREIIHSNPQATWTPEENNTKETREAREQLEKKDQETEKIFDEVLSLTRIVSPETIKRAEDDAGLSYETTEYEFYSQNKGAVAKKYWGRRGNEGQWEKHSKEEIDACRANLQNILGEDIEEEQAQSFLTLGGYEIETILGARRKKTAKDFFGMGKMFKTPKEKTIIKIAGQEVPLLDFVLNLEGSQKRAIQEIKEITRNKWKNGRRSFRLSLLDKARDLVE